jgi:pyruvate-formate lyase-activating enzyme
MLVAASWLFGALGCGADLPPSLPSTEALARSASRVELVDLVISDRARAEKVRRLYVEIEELMLEVKRTTAGELVKLGVENPTRTDAETRAAVDKVRDAEVAAFRRYVGLQMELRRSMNAKEFAKLDRIK